MRLVENLSHRQRELTPIDLATWLVDAVRRTYGRRLVAVLWVRKDSPYKLLDDVECYDIDRDAYTYSGPHPVICHPPCGPHGRYRAVSKQDAYAGHLAMELADRYGGVVEQPASSSLFRGGQVIRQYDYGHLAEKLTRLRWSYPMR